jgi:hypothetical protein
MRIVTHEQQPPKTKLIMVAQSRIGESAASTAS